MASNGPNRIQAFANDAIVYFSRHDNLLLRHLIGGKPVETKWVFVQSSPVLCSGSIVMAPLSSILTTICGLNELGRHTTRGITHVLSIMDPDSPEPRIFETFQPHRRTTLRFHHEIDPGPNLMSGTPAHRIREDAVNPRRGEQQRQPTQNGEQNRIESLRRDRAVDHFLERPHISDRQVGIHSATIERTSASSAIGFPLV